MCLNVASRRIQAHFNNVGGAFDGKRMLYLLMLGAVLLIGILAGIYLHFKNRVIYEMELPKPELLESISVKKDIDEPHNLWTVWSDDNKAFEHSDIDDEIKTVAWNYIDFCGHCGSCGGGKKKTVFGKEFDGVCGCTFRVDNPKRSDLPFLKKIVEICKGQSHKMK